MNDAWIESDSLSKKFSESYAINDVSFKLVENSSSLIGPNRAGKSTLIGMMEGLIHPTNGYTRVLNRYPEESALEIRKKIGFTSE
ncbi:MAG: ATP-binding cassette domain-containing protein [Candidatus Thermoplasmatota archaeon]|nr:ATP-binding cassette domain-containing protein [Candidatus Thermoplasmatota archaeon]